jgi:hypothetical protein
LEDKENIIVMQEKAPIFCAMTMARPRISREMAWSAKCTKFNSRTSKLHSLHTLWERGKEEKWFFVRDT